MTTPLTRPAAAYSAPRSQDRSPASRRSRCGAHASRKRASNLAAARSRKLPPVGQLALLAHPVERPGDPRGRPGTRAEAPQLLRRAVVVVDQVVELERIDL